MVRYFKHKEQDFVDREGIMEVHGDFEWARMIGSSSGYIADAKSWKKMDENCPDWIHGVALDRNLVDLINRNYIEIEDLDEAFLELI